MTGRPFYGDPMRWGLLFGDIEAQVDEALRLERESSAAEVERAEFTRVRFRDRLRGAEGRVVTLEVAGVGRLEGVVRRVGSDWLIVEEGASDWLIFTPSILSATGVGASAPPAEGALWERLGVASALRTVSRDRSAVRVFLSSDGQGSPVRSGVIARVGADFLDLWEADRAMEAGGRHAVHTIPLAAFRALQGGAGAGAFGAL